MPSILIVCNLSKPLILQYQVKSKAPRGGPSTSRLCDAHSSNNVTADDCVSLNPDGRDRRDESKTKTKLLSCKQYTNVAMVNVRTIRLESKRQELANNCRNQQINILGVVDHKIVHEDPVVYEQIGGNTLITTSAWGNSNNAAVGGVGLLLDRCAKSALFQK